MFIFYKQPDFKELVSETIKHKQYLVFNFKSQATSNFKSYCYFK